ncbi:MAG TPA: DUF5977 domain-containing protein [Puia sp.]|nr:DUF5977 domain-containing protein [Puia sp.]
MTLIPYLALSQQGVGPNTMPDISSPAIVSPNAAALGKYGEIPVGYYTGIPSISIPLYEIKTGSLDLPVSLSYHAGGIKVEEIASWVGMGWSLNAGGVISRQLRGLPDEEGGGYLQDYSRLNQYLYGGMSTADQIQFFKDIERGTADCEQDIFNYNFGGQSGKFIFDSSGQVITIPRSRMKIEYGNFMGQTGNWKVTDLSGVQYYFANRELSQTIPVTNNALSPTPSNHVPTSWYLSKIISALGTDSIVFTYTLTESTMTSGVSQTRYYYNGGGLGTCSQKNTDSRTSITNLTGWRLSAITFNNGSIIFHQNTQARCDFPQDFALSSIEIRNTSGSFDKFYTLYQSYLYSSGTACDASNPENARLFLDSIRFADAANLNNGTYSFKYNNSQLLPNRLSYSQDHWGYYNGANNGIWLVPTTNVPSPYGDVITLTGANRECNSTFTQAGILQSITYPTGGRTEFQYEPNTVGNYPGNTTYYQQTTNVDTSFFVLQPDATTLKFDTSFTLSAGGSTVNVQINNGGGICAQQDEIGCPLVWITDTSGYNSGNIRTNQPINNMADGVYTVHVDLSTASSTIKANFAFSVRWQQSELSIDSLHHNLTVGGLRIKSITDFSFNNTVTNVHQYQYLFPDSIDYSSGFALSLPEYMGSMVDNSSTGDGSQVFLSSCPFVTINSSSNYPLEATQSSYVGYKYVTELLGQNGEFGKNVYQFRSPDVVADILGVNSPFPPAQSRDWERGQTLVTKSYRYDSAHNTYILVQEKRNGFGYLTTDIYIGLKVSRYQFYSGSYLDEPSTLDYAAAQYGTEVGWVPLMVDTGTLYDQNNAAASTQKISSYTYSDVHFQPLTMTTTNSNGDTLITHMSYPLDFTSLSGTDGLTIGIQSLQNANIVSPVIEKYIQRKSPNGSFIGTEGSLLTSYSSQSLLPDTIWATQFIKPTPSFGSLAVAGGTLVKDGAYLPQVFNNKYDLYGNVMVQQKIHDVKHSYIWDYLGTYPIANVVNADSSDIAYTSFEADGNGNWTIGIGSFNTGAAITGRNSYNLTGIITKSALNTSTVYLVSYWTQGGPLNIGGTIAGYPQKGKSTVINGNSWTFYIHKVTGQSTIAVSGNATVDELRLYPATAQMTTYTYDPLVGMTSQADVGSRITYYEYDGLARLKRVRDQDYNILKSLEYQYQVPAFYSNSEQDSVFIRDNCAVGASPSSVTYSVPAGTVTSSISGDDANAQARTLLRQRGPGYADSLGTCTWFSSSQSGTFTRDNCGSGATPSSTSYSLPAGSASSVVSLADANNQALALLNTKGHAHADSVCTCTWYNAPLNSSFTRDDCGSGYITNGSVPVTIPAGTFSSIISQQDADQQAINAAQAHADSVGSCVLLVNLTLVNNVNAIGVTALFTNTTTGQQYPINLDSSTPGSVPAGTYDVTFSSSTIYFMGFLCGLSSAGTSFTIHNVDVTTCNQLYIDSQGQGN